MKKWHELDVRPEFASERGRYEDLDYAVGKLFAVHQERFFQKLHDDYSHFEIVRLDQFIDNVSSRPRCISMSCDGNTGFIGVLGSGSPAKSRILRTTDGGITWHDVSPPSNVGPIEGVCGIHTSDGITIWAAGSYHDGASNSGVIISTDGGETWCQTLRCQSAVDIWFNENGEGLVVGRDEDWPALWVSFDKGENWVKHLLDDDKYLEMGIGWKIFNYRDQELLVSISAGERGPRSGMYVNSALRTGWTGVSVDTTQPNLHGIGRDETSVWLGRKGVSMIESADRKNWTEAMSASNFNMTDINRILLTEDGYYAAGDHLYVLR